MPESAPPLPRSIWVVAWASLAGQALLVLRNGGRVDDDVSQVVSMVLGALLVGYVSAGVVRARRIRIVLAWVVLTLGFAGGLAEVIWAHDPAGVVHAVLMLATSVASLLGLATLRRSDWYAWQRTRPTAREGPPSASWLGGYVGLGDGGVSMRVNVDVG